MIDQKLKDIITDLSKKDLDAEQNKKVKKLVRKTKLKEIKTSN